MAIPAYKRDRPQSLDESVLGSFKPRRSKAVCDRSRAFGMDLRSRIHFRSLDMKKCIQTGFLSFLSRVVIESGLKKTGIWPLDSCSICANGVRSSHINRNWMPLTSLNMDINRYFPDVKRNGPTALTVSPFFISTHTTIELTCEDVRSELRFIELDRPKKRKGIEKLKAQKESERGKRCARKMQQRKAVDIFKAVDSDRRDGLWFSIYRLSHKRRKVVCENFLKRRFSVLMNGFGMNARQTKNYKQYSNMVYQSILTRRFFFGPVLTILQSCL